MGRERFWAGGHQSPKLEFSQHNSSLRYVVAQNNKYDKMLKTEFYCKMHIMSSKIIVVSRKDRGEIDCYMSRKEGISM